MAARSARIILLCVALAGAALAGAATRDYFLLGREAPDFALRAGNGPTVRLSESRGDVVLLAFFGSRCGQCAAQLEAVGRLQARYGMAGLAALAVDVDDDQQAALRYIASRSVSMPLLLDPEKAVARAYRVDNLPMLLLLDRAGTVRHVHRGHGPDSELLYADEAKVLLDE